MKPLSGGILLSASLSLLAHADMIGVAADFRLAEMSDIIIKYGERFRRPDKQESSITDAFANQQANSPDTLASCVRTKSARIWCGFWCGSRAGGNEDRARH